ncbi:MAG: ATP-binding protein [Lentimicrobiaceae bacterium]|nr:ATP-binding protein [Lentimicrobiaceae bacterium]
MENIHRLLQKVITENLTSNKVCMLLGARRVGKTVLIKEIQKSFQGNVMYLNAEDIPTRQVLMERSIFNYQRLLSGVDLLIIDEAQTIKDIGKILKLIADEVENIKILVTGSSAFDLLNLTGEPLTGRMKVFYLYPFSQSELSSSENVIRIKQSLEEKLIYGVYPEVYLYNSYDEKKQYLYNLVNSYLLKDILALDGLRNTSKMFDLLKLLSFQVGKEVVYDELAKQSQLSKNTVEKYIELLSKAFVVFKLGGFSKNLRKEIRKANKWYFYDNGIRNTLISNFNPLSLRTDTGELWENYIISERMKKNSYNQQNVNYYFWRTYDQQEIDFLEEYDENLKATEIKWKSKEVKVPKAFKDAYPEAKFQVINPMNYLDWIS